MRVVINRGINELPRHVHDGKLAICVESNTVEPVYSVSIRELIDAYQSPGL